MPECDYCGAEFNDEDAYVTHLRETHEDELGAIDRRRVESAEGGDGGLDIGTGPLALGVVLVGSIAVLALAMTMTGGSGGGGGGSDVQGSESNPPGSVDQVVRTPRDLGAVHYHGTMRVVIEGERIDFGQSRYQLQADAFHFEAGDGTRWHVHARDVTLEYALATLGIGVTDSTVTFEGRTYRDSNDGTSVTVTVNGEPVTPSTYVLQRGDEVRIVVETS